MIVPTTAGLRADAASAGVTQRLPAVPPPRRGSAPDDTVVLSPVGPQVSVVLPARDERSAVADAVVRASAALRGAGVSFEIVVVDDADDAASDPVRALAARGHPVTVLRRGRAQRAGGPAGALVHGLGRAQGQVVAVLDVELQHPPEVLAELVVPILDDRADLVVGTRDRDGSRDAPGGRVASRVVRSVVRALVPAARQVSDPRTGPFAVRADLVRGVVLEPQSSAILLEVLARVPWRRLVEVPYRSGSRRDGVPARGAAGITGLLRHVARIVLRPRPGRRVHNGLLRPAGPLRPRDADGSRRRRRHPLRGATAAEHVTGSLLVGFLVAQIAHILLLRNGPFLDEGIYIAAGLRTLDGYGIEDGYLGWFAGSLLWPTLSGAAFGVGGLTGSRILAAVFVTVAAACAARAAHTLYGDRAAAWGTAAFLVAAPVLQLGHLAVYDVVAVAGLAATLLCLAEWRRRDGVGWLAGAAVCLAVAVLGKYAAAFLVVPAVLGLIVVRGRRTAGPLLLFGLVLAGVLIAFFLPWRHQLAYFLDWRVDNNPGFGVTREMVVFEQVQYAGPFIALAALGVVLARREHRVECALIAGSMLVFPVYHVLLANSVSAVKHVVFGLVMSVPVLGVALDRVAGRTWWRVLPVALVPALALTVTVPQVQRMDRGWVDATAGGEFLAAHVRPGDRLMIPNAWQVLPFLHDDAVPDPTLVTDAYGWQNADPGIDVCAQDWVVESVNDNAWPDEVMRQLAACGTFAEVFRSRNEVTNLTRELRYLTYTAEFVVYENTGAPS